MEVGRNDLAGQFDLNAEQISAAGIWRRWWRLELKFKRPARFDEELRVVTSVRRTETATLEFHLPHRRPGRRPAVPRAGPSTS